ncbi:hypothetical protein NPJ82_09180 [Sphingomonas sp. NY01]|uniref:hypothetical protein n=1 Tax=Sphingomonas sp. NY01 TaxID=2968057 RepID=UPI00315DED81
MRWPLFFRAARPARDPLAPLRADLDARLAARREQRPTEPRSEKKRFDHARPMLNELRREIAQQQVLF